MTVSFKTIGCKLNKVETIFLENAFEEAGYEVLNDKKSEIYVINTCTVTQSADRQVRQITKKLRRENPDSLIALVGCFVQSNQIKDIISYADIFLGVNNKLKLIEYVKKKPQNKVIDIEPINNKFEYKIFEHCSNLSRAIIKLQDGCDFNCSYCIIPIVRGKSRSLPPDAVIEQIEKLVLKGYKEIVLSGINIGDYGKNLHQNIDLSKLLNRLNQFPNIRFRLTSIEPMSLSESLIETITGLENICPHFHIPLQSGDNSILEAMGRKYTTNEYERKLMKILDLKRDASIGTDIIVGFPKENIKCFENTKQFVCEMPFSYFHVFPYSRRLYTKSTFLREFVNDKEKKRRCSIMRELGKEKSIKYKKMFLGKSLKVIFEGKKKGNFFKGVSENYIKVLVEPNEKIIKPYLKNELFKHIFNVTVNILDEDNAYGILS